MLKMMQFLQRLEQVMPPVLDRFFRNHSFKVIFVAILLLPLATRGGRYALTSNDNNIKKWLPTSSAATQDFDWFQENFENETFILASWDGCTLDSSALEIFARKLVQPPETIDPAKPAPFFKSVQTGPQLLDRLMASPSNLSKAEAIDRLQGLFVGPLPEQAPVKHKRRVKGAPAVIDPALLDDKRITCAVITLTDSGKFNLRTTLAEVVRIATEEVGLPEGRLHFGGPPVDEVAVATEGEKTLLRLFIPAGIMGISLAYWCLRSVRLTTMVFATALYAAAVSLAIVKYSGGTMNAILLTMPAVVYVAGISGAIHFANYYRDSVAESGVAGAAARAVMHAWVPCLLTVCTTAAGLLSLYTSNLAPIKWFGVYSAVGIVGTLFFMFLFLPAWMELWPMKPHSALDGEEPKLEDIALPQSWRRFLTGVLGYHHLVFAALLAIMIAGGIGLSKVQTSIKLTKLFSPSADILQDYTWLETHLGPLVPMEVVLDIDDSVNKMTLLERMRLVDKVQRELKSLGGDVGNTMSAVTFAPSLKSKRVGLLSKTMYDNTLNARLVAHRDDFAEGGMLGQTEDNHDLWRISVRVRALGDTDYGEFVDTIKGKVEPVLAAERARMAAQVVKRNSKQPQTNAEIAAAATLAGAAAEKAGTKAIADGGSDSPADKFARSADKAAGPTVSVANGGDFGLTARYTGLVPLVYKAQREMLDGLKLNFAYDVLTIMVVMAVFFMDISTLLVILLPSIFPLVVVFGVMGWQNILVDVGSVMAPTVALGVSVDDVVHFLIWYRNGLKQGRTRRGAVMLAYEGCARAMYQSWAVLGLGLSVFALSSFVPTQRFGALMFTMLTAALAANLLLLPAILVSPLGYFFGRRLMKNAAQEDSEHDAMVKDSGELAAAPAPLTHADAMNGFPIEHEAPAALMQQGVSTPTLHPHSNGAGAQIRRDSKHPLH